MNKRPGFPRSHLLQDRCPITRLQSIDLNLLIALDHLLRERSVTRAAAAMELSQPALSASLARLRRHFDDPLLVRQGNSYVLSPVAARLREQVRVAVGHVAHVFAPDIEFDPRQCRREFRVVTSDYGGIVGVPELSRRMAQAAPHASIRTVHISNDFVSSTPESLRDVDVMMLPHGVVGRLPHRDIHEDRWVCVVAADNDRVSEVPTPEELGALPWVLPFGASTSFAALVDQLRALRIEVRTQVVVQTFMSIPALVEGTLRVAVMQERLAEKVASEWNLRLMELPFETIPIQQALWWHPVHEDDIEHRWFRTLLDDHLPLSP